MNNQSVQTGFTSIEQVTNRYLTGAGAAVQKQQGASFAQILSEKQAVEGGLKFSRHANERMFHRQIALSETQLARLESATKRAEAKGIRESLVMVDNYAFIVNIKNNTVVTAVGEADEKIFTNIDGAVIV